MFIKSSRQILWIGFPSSSSCLRKVRRETWLPTLGWARKPEESKSIPVGGDQFSLWKFLDFWGKKVILWIEQQRKFYVEAHWFLRTTINLHLIQNFQSFKANTYFGKYVVVAYPETNPHVSFSGSGVRQDRVQALKLQNIVNALTSLRSAAHTYSLASVRIRLGQNA